MALMVQLEQFTTWSLRHLTLILFSCALTRFGVTGSGMLAILNEGQGN